MIGKIRTCCRVSGSTCCMRISSIIRGSGIVFYGSLGPLQNEELLCDYHQLLVKPLDPSEREESSKQLRHRSVSGKVHKNRFFRRSGEISRRSVSHVKEGFLLKRGRLQQTAEEGYTRWRKFERCSSLEDGASQDWWQGWRAQRGDRQFCVVGFW